MEPEGLSVQSIFTTGSHEFAEYNTFLFLNI
jgi:hypothetical protein